MGRTNVFPIRGVLSRLRRVLSFGLTIQLSQLDEDRKRSRPKCIGVAIDSASKELPQFRLQLIAPFRLFFIQTGDVVTHGNRDPSRKFPVQLASPLSFFVPRKSSTRDPFLSPLSSIIACSVAIRPSCS